jgi:glutathione S-transferase
MAQPPLHLIIGNYNTSSWSLRAWLALRLARLAFVETRIPLRTAETPGRIAALSPSGKLPVLLAEGVPIWDSLAIAEFVAELEPGIWPLDPIARAEARSISAEMHSGFADLRRLMPMDVVSRFSPPGRQPRGLAADIARIKAIWSHCRARFASHGPFLFGPFSIVDCMMAPVATRFVTHGVPVDGAVEDYVDSVMSWPDMVTWCDAASAEQTERETTGALDIVELTRPGRVLGRDPDATPAPHEAPRGVGPAPQAAGGSADRQIDGSVPPPPVTVPPAPPAPARGTANDLAGDAAPAPSDESEARPLRHEPERPPEPAAAPPPPEPAGSPPPKPAAGPPAPPETLPAPVDAVGAAPPPPALPRRRLFEPAPTIVPEASPAAMPPPAAAAAPPSPGDPSGMSAGKAAEPPAPAPRLGWIRRPVPSEAAPEIDEPLAPLPQRRPSFADDDPRPASTGRQEGAGPGDGAPPPRPGPGRAAGPAVKPIGGGILRRR